MTTRTRRALIALSLIACGALTGCATQAPTLVSYNSSESFSQPTSLASLTTLGAGDTLGHEVYRQDVYLAYLEQVQNNTATASATDADNAGE
jgi:hypothetical protein